MDGGGDWKGEVKGTSADCAARNRPNSSARRGSRQQRARKGSARARITTPMTRASDKPRAPATTPGNFDPKVFLATIGQGRSILKIRKNAKLFSQGDSCDSIFYIQEGKVRLTVVSKTGKEATIGILDQDNFCGEGCLAGERTRIGSATALTDCKVLRIGKKDMLEVLHSQQTFSDLFVAYLLSRNKRYQEDLIDQLFNSSEKRLARILLLLAGFGGNGIPANTGIPNISQEVLAGLVGTTRSRVSLFMNKFRKMGFIDYNGEIEVHSSLLSVVLHE